MTIYLRFHAVSIVSPDPIELGAPMEVNCSVATIGGLQKLPGIDDPFLIHKLSIYQKTRDGVFNHIAQLDTLPAQSKTVRHCLFEYIKSFFFLS